MDLAVNSVAHSTEPEPGAEPDWTPGAIVALRTAESRANWAREVAQALANLRSDERLFILLSYVKGVEHAYIAAQAGIPVSLVSRTIAAGLQRLAVTLERP